MKSTKKTAKEEVIDSWEDDDASSPDETEDKTPDVKAPSPSPSPPTITSTNADSTGPTWSDTTTKSLPCGEPKRPEKTDLVARRMIAAGLGIKAPKQTEEQKAYHKAVRDKEKKRRDEERAQEQKRREETERAKAAIWND